MKNLGEYIDAFQMVVTKYARNGTHSVENGCAILYAAIREDDINTEAMLGLYTPKLEVESGKYCRHPDTDEWYSKNEFFGKHQLIPLILYLGLIGQTAALRRLYRAHMKRFFLFAWNTGENHDTQMPDITGPTVWSAYIRSFNNFLLYPLLFIFDVLLVLDSVLCRAGLGPYHAELSHIMLLDFSSVSMPTPLSWLARSIYGKETAIAHLKEVYGGENMPPVDDYMIEMIEENW